MIQSLHPQKHWLSSATLSATLVALTSFGSAAQAATYYVSPGGSNANNGTSTGSAWQTLTRVNLQNFAPGDQVLFQGGQSFAGTLNLSAEDAGDGAGTVSIGSYGGGRATINGGSGNGIYVLNAGHISIGDINVVGSGASSNTGSGILFENTLSATTLDFLRINNVEVSGFGNNGIGVFAYNYNDSGATTIYNDVRITNAVVRDNMTGIETWGEKDFGALTNVYVGNCRTYNNAGRPDKRGNGIVLGAVNAGTVERCVAYNNGANTNIQDGPVGIWAYTSNAVTIQFNEAYDNRTSNGDGGGFDLDIGVTNSVMQYNYSHGNDGAGYLVYGAGGGNVVRYNISQNDGRKNNIPASSLYVGGPNTNVDVYQNTFYMTPTPNGSKPPVIKLTDGSARLRNNIFVSTQGAPVVLAPATANMLLQGNDYWSSGAAFVINWGGTTYNSLGAWRSATGQEKNGNVSTGFNLDPRMADPGNGPTLGNANNLSTLGAYKLQLDSPLINAGLNLTGSPWNLSVGNQDYHGGALPQGGIYDIGAHELTRGANLVANPGFEANGSATQTPANWSEWSPTQGGDAWSFVEGNNDPYGGSYHLVHQAPATVSGYTIGTYQVVWNLPNGLYTLRGWVRSSGGQPGVVMAAKNFGGPSVSVPIPASTTWQLVTLSNINVTNGALQVDFYSEGNGGQWINVDDVDLFKQ